MYGTAADTLLEVAAEVDFILFLFADNKELVRRFNVNEDRCVISSLLLLNGSWSDYKKVFAFFSFLFFLLLTREYTVYYGRSPSRGGHFST